MKRRERDVDEGEKAETDNVPALSRALLAIPLDVLVHHVSWLTFAEKLSSRLVCKRLMLVGGLSVSRVQKNVFSVERISSP